MAFVFRQERKLGPQNIQTGKMVGPGSYNDGEITTLRKQSELKTVSVKQPFQTMVDREGRNIQSHQNLRGVNESVPLRSNPSNLGVQPHAASTPDLPYYNQAIEENRRLKIQMIKSQNQMGPGPGQYEINQQGFANIHKKMNQAQHLREQGIEEFGVEVIKKSSNFISKKNRFDDRELRDKAMLPGPGAYNQSTEDIQNMIGKKSGTSLRMDMKNQPQSRSGPKIINPPSIPSHQTVFGYEENQKGQLIKQQSNLIGFTGEKHDKVGPGDYDLSKAPNVVNRTVTGVVQWKKPGGPKPPKMEEAQNARKMQPGPGEYEIPGAIAQSKKPSSSAFKSGVQRSATTTGFATSVPQTRSNTAVGRGFIRTQGGFNQGGVAIRPGTTTALTNLGHTSMGQTPQDLDIFEEEEEQQPGPGSYYNPATQTSFKTGKRPERLQFFGSTVERFNGNKTKKLEQQEPGPGTYSIQGLIQQNTQQHPAHNQIYSGFYTNERRFAQNATKSVTPGPGQYDQNRRDQKVTSKSGVFGSTQRRFTQSTAKANMPGPGQYNAGSSLNPEGRNNTARPSQKQNAREQMRKSNSMSLQKGKPIHKSVHSQLQAQSYIQQNQEAIRQATKNYQNQIQYDNQSNTIANNVKKMSGGSNPILTALKSGPKSQIGFGSKPPRYENREKLSKNNVHYQQMNDRPEDYLGPGYYEQRGGFDQMNTNQTAAQKILQAGGTNRGSMFVPQAKSQQNFMSNAPRFDYGPDQKKAKLVPGPGQYGQAPGDEGSYNPWFKRSYNMLYADQQR